MTWCSGDEDGYMDGGAAPAGLEDEEIDGAGQLFNDFSDSSSLSSRQYGDDDGDDIDEHHLEHFDWRVTIKDEGGSPPAALGNLQSSSVQLPPMLTQAWRAQPAATAGHRDSSQSGQALRLLVAAPSGSRSEPGYHRVDAEEEEVRDPGRGGQQAARRLQIATDQPL